MLKYFIKWYWGLPFLIILMLGGASLSGAIEASPGAASRFQVVFNPSKPVYRLGESIEFNIKANKNFYLYLFSIDEQRNQGRVLLPNALQQKNRYAAYIDHVIPGGRFELVGDRAGTEKTLLVASTNKLKIDSGNLDKSGAFFSAGASEIKNMAKALYVRPKDERVLAEITVVVTN